VAVTSIASSPGVESSPGRIDPAEPGFSPPPPPYEHGELADTGNPTTALEPDPRVLESCRAVVLSNRADCLSTTKLTKACRRARRPQHMKHLLSHLIILATLHADLAWSQEQRVYTFGVISQRSPILTAQYWNPILQFVAARSGVALELRVARTGEEHADAVRRGEFDFIYSNHNFAPANDRAGYRVIARPAQAAISGQIVVLADSPVRSLADLNGKEVAFPSKAAFVGYHVPMDALLRQGIGVSPQFAGNQEGAMAQLKSQRVVAAGVNSQVMRDFAKRENLAYRVLWSSEPYHNLPVSARPNVPAATVTAVRDALVAMAADTDGARVLSTSAELVKQDPPLGFVLSADRDYENLRRFYRSSLVKSD
jgi:phosphonate transport system substrate-binding protein